MDYRLKYRDIPWHVAFMVPFGKVFGTLFIKWPAAFINNLKDSLVITGLITFLTVAIFVMIHYVTDGQVNLLGNILRYIGLIR